MALGDSNENGENGENKSSGSRLPVVIGGIAVMAVAAFVVVRMMGPSAPVAPKTDVAPAVVPAPPLPAPAPKPEPPKVVESPKKVAPKAPKPEAEAPPPAAETAPAPAADAGILKIDSDVPGAQIFIDREYLGTTPLTGVAVKPGRHQLNASAKGFDGVAETLEIQPGVRDLMIRFKEVKLELALDVVHKHRIGSCQGRLLATPQGLRYDTSNKDDAFTTPLGTLEVFEIDYKEKNLRVKLPKGKRFDFTDPGGNADKLFVFHRDVDKARLRLTKGDAAPAQP
jgi:hypothetical protein